MARVHSIFVQGRGAHNGTTEILYFLNSKSSSRIKCSKLHATHQFHNAYHLALSATEIFNKSCLLSRSDRRYCDKLYV